MRKAPVYPLDPKPAAFPPPDSPSGSSIHAAFHNFRERSKVVASAGSLDFATHKEEALKDHHCIRGFSIWFLLC
jgi:hypothetical protein